MFDAYAQFEELNLNHLMEELATKTNPSEDDDIEVDLKMARFEDLMDRRPLLLNSVLLRQNPHNVAEWHKRVQLYEGKPHEIINTYTEAVQTVDPKLAVGKLHTLWVDFAKFYEKNKQIDDSRIVFEKGTQVKTTAACLIELQIFYTIFFSLQGPLYESRRTGVCLVRVG